MTKDIGSDLLHSRISGATSQLLETWIQGQIILNEVISASLLGIQGKLRRKRNYNIVYFEDTTF